MRQVQDKKLTVPCITNAVLWQRPLVNADIVMRRTSLKSCANKT